MANEFLKTEPGFTEPSPMATNSGIVTPANTMGETPVIQPVKVDLSKAPTTIPATVLSSNITKGRTQTLIDDINNTFVQRLAATAPTQLETDTRQRITDLTGQIRGLQTEQVRRQANIEGDSGLVQALAGRQVNNLQKEIATRQLPLVNELQGQADILSNLQAIRQQTLQALQLSAEQGQFNLNLARDYEKTLKAEQKEVRDAVMKAGINAPFVNINGTVYNMQKGAQGVATPEQFFAEAGVRSFDEARQMGILADFVSAETQDRNFQIESEMFDRAMQQQEFDLKLWQATNPTSDLKTQIIDSNGQKIAVTTDAEGNIIKEQVVGAEANGTANQLNLAQAQDQILSIDKLLTQNSGLNSAVGPNAFSRSTNFFRNLFSSDLLTGAKANFVGEVEKIRSQLSLENLIQAKSRGATFGALSEGEMRILSASATKLGSWAIEKDGKVIGYNVSEKDFKAEMDKINNFAKMDYILKGGDPAAVGVRIEPDGAYTTQNSDGTITEILAPNNLQSSFNSVGKTSASTDVKKIASAIGQYESGGNYQARGPVVTSGMYKGQRALGKYQIMPGNLPSWSKAALGRVVTEQEFMSNPKIQDAIAEHQMSKALAQYKDPRQVASIWFSGRPMQGNNAKDVIGTSVPKYIQNVMSIYNRQG